MRFCFCGQPVFGTDKKTGEGFCKNHQSYRTDIDKRSIVQKAISKNKYNSTLHKKVRRLIVSSSEELGSSSSMQNLIRDLDSIFSQYIRIKYANKEGIVTCFVCNAPFPWSGLDNGHYISRTNLATRFMEDNCYPQCKRCNNIHNDDKEPFKKAINEYRPGLIDFLEEQARIVYSPALFELKALIIEYRSKLEMVKLKLVKTGI